MQNAERRQDASVNTNAAVIVTRDGRRLALKRLDDDCLLDGELHPSIALRLERVREMPMTAMANLHGVEVIDGRAFMVWDYVQGRTIEAILGTLEPSDRARLKRDLLLIIGRLHGHGIVHGALHGRNIIVDERGGLHLTHVSPLLHNDPKGDLAMVAGLFGAADVESGEGAGGAIAAGAPDPLRAWALGGAVVAALMGAAVVVWFWWHASV